MSETFLKRGIWRWVVVVNEDSNSIDLEEIFSAISTLSKWRSLIDQQ